ncbi:uncharacterized protein LOC144107914 [Amblyomma americanum]
MEGTKYTLTGFDDFLERRRVVFVEPLPSTRVCGLCGVVSGQSLLLPCGDVLCHVCSGSNGTEGGTCPLDGLTFTEADIVSMSFKQSHLEEHRVFCIVGGEQCGFAGKLSELKDHLAACRNDRVTCAKCQNPLVRSEAGEHYRKCSARIPVRKTASTIAVASAVEKLRDVKKDLEGLREGVSSGKMEHEGVVNCANSLVERMGCFENDLIQLEKAGADKRDSLVPALTKTVVSAIPSCATSKPGVFIAACAFTDVYAGYKALSGDKKEHRLSTTICTLAGYTFKVDCFLKKGKNDVVLLSFALYLRDGAWDDWVEWPFTKNVTVIIRHPRDEGNDIRLPLRMEDPKMVRRPPPETWNMGKQTGTLNWNDLEMRGFFRSKNLFINVQFE